MDLSELLLANLALIPRSLGVIVLPLQLRPLQPLHRITTWARHIEPPLIAAQILCFDPAEVLHRWGASKQNLAPRKRCCTLLRQAHRVAFAIHIKRERIHLIAEDVPARR